MERVPTYNTRAAFDRLRAHTSNNMFVFGRYQNLNDLYEPIRDWMNSADWDTFTERFCSAHFPHWQGLSDPAKRALANSVPYRVIMLDVRINANATITYNYVRTADNEPLFDIHTTLRTCEVDPATGCAYGLPPHIQEALLTNAFINLAFAGNIEDRRIIIDLYPDRPVRTVHGFHKDSNDLQGPSENLEYVSLLFLPPEDVVTRGTVLSSGPLDVTDTRETASLLCRAGTTLMFRDQSFLQADGTVIPSLIHATPQPTPTGDMNSIQDRLTFNYRTPAASAAIPADFATHYPRLFVRVHTSLRPRIGTVPVLMGDTVPIPDTFQTMHFPTLAAESLIVNDDVGIILALRHLDQLGYTAGKGSRSKSSRTKTRKSKGKNIKDVHFYCKKENYTSFCKSLTGSLISFASTEK